MTPSVIQIRCPGCQTQLWICDGQIVDEPDFGADPVAYAATLLPIELEGDAKAFYRELGARLRAARESLGLSIERLAREVPCGTTSLLRYELGQTRASPDVFVAIATALLSVRGRIAAWPESTQ
jgi:hypothetical protein